MMGIPQAGIPVDLMCPQSPTWQWAFCYCLSLPRNEEEKRRNEWKESLVYNMVLGLRARCLLQRDLYMVFLLLHLFPINEHEFRATLTVQETEIFPSQIGVIQNFSEISPHITFPFFSAFRFKSWSLLFLGLPFLWFKECTFLEGRLSSFLI